MEIRCPWILIDHLSISIGYPRYQLNLPNINWIPWLSRSQMEIQKLHLSLLVYIILPSQTTDIYFYTL